MQPSKGVLPCSVDRAMALSFLGYRGQSLDFDLEKRLELMAQRCEDENAARFVWRTFDILHNDVTKAEKESAAEVLNNGAPEAEVGPVAESCICLSDCLLGLPGQSIATHLDGAQRVTLLAVTLGTGWQRTLEELKASSPTDALLYDACASAATEAAANAAHALLAKAARDKGLEARARFSPGYGDLPLDVHPAFLQALDAPRKIGLFATESNLLAPAKSITAIIGLFAQESEGARKQDRVDDAASSGDTINSGIDAQCATCAAFDYCNFRENGETCHG